VLLRSDAIGHLCWWWATGGTIAQSAIEPMETDTENGGSWLFLRTVDAEHIGWRSV
jgi:hypothetical protein